VDGLELALNFILDKVIDADIESVPKYKNQWKSAVRRITYSHIFEYADDRLRAI
jgi:hypothetical protein